MYPLKLAVIRPDARSLTFRKPYLWPLSSVLSRSRICSTSDRGREVVEEKEESERAQERMSPCFESNSASYGRRQHMLRGVVVMMTMKRGDIQRYPSRTPSIKCM